MRVVPGQGQMKCNRKVCNACQRLIDLHALFLSPVTLPVLMCFHFRRYPLPAAKTMPMPEPKYLEHDDGDIDNAGKVGDAGEGEPSRTGGKTGLALATWMPLMCQAAAEDIVRSAVTNVSGVQWCEATT